MTIHMLRALSSVRHVSAIVGALAGIAAAGFTLTTIVFPPTLSRDRRVTFTTTLAARTVRLTGQIARTTPASATLVSTTTVVSRPGSAPSTVTLTATVPRARTPTAASRNVWIPLAAVIGTSLMFIALALGFSAARRRQVKRVDQEIAVIATQAKDPAIVAERVRVSLGRRGRDHALVRQRLRRRFVDSLSRDALDETLLEFLPHRPRSVKRALNDLLLRSALAVELDLLREDSPVEPRHLTKWVVLVHRWPELADALQQRPDLVLRLESASNKTALSNLVNELNTVTDITELFEFMQTSPPLAQALKMIMAFDVSETDTTLFARSS
jgi:hypothetical protein